GTGAQLSDADISPYLGKPGSVPPWDLTDAVGAGDIPKALGVLARLLDAGERHPIAVLSILRSHYQRIHTVAVAGITDEKAAAKLLGMKGSTFPAKKAVGDARRLGTAKIE